MADRLFPDRLEFVTPSEVLKNHGYDFADDIPDSDSLKAADCTVTAIDDDGFDVTATIVSGKNISGTNLRANLAGFLPAKNYLVTYKAVMTTSGDAREKHTMIKSRSRSAVG